MVTRLADGVWWFDLQGVNAYLVDDGEVTLVDTGMPWHASEIQTGIERVVGSLSAVDRVLMTHFDFDHVGGLNGLVDSGLDAPVAIGVDDEPYLARRERPVWHNRKGLFQRVTDITRDAPAVPLEPVEDGDTVGGFNVYHTPGHTPGHTAFVDESRSLALVGDLVRERGGEFRVPPWFLNYDHQEAEASLQSYVERAPAVDVVCQGHGTPFVESGSDQLSAVAGTLAAAE
ncbi:MBL fold metallo-hydrolase [Salinibaculum rarum]|uniref:MBL fold metallo-hydrolase n=1 Tax=Salinibaculum rarum TaxID=3058903 RepID=UPI0026602391|nr:MBL fold metallo-hydrolase [Salinibaculum sp. KK48]